MYNQNAAQYVFPFYEWPENLPEPEAEEWFPWKTRNGERLRVIPISSTDELITYVLRYGRFFMKIDHEFRPISTREWLTLLVYSAVYGIEDISGLPSIESASPSESEEGASSSSHSDDDENELGFKPFSEMARRRFDREVEIWQVDAPFGCRLQSSDCVCQRWVVEVIGAAETLYAGEAYQLQIDFPEQYPLDSPQVKFVPPVPLHPLVYRDGHIISGPAMAWSPTMTVSSLCESILSMLSESTVKENFNNDQCGRLNLNALPAFINPAHH